MIATPSEYQHQRMIVSVAHFRLLSIRTRSFASPATLDDTGLCPIKPPCVRQAHGPVEGASNRRVRQSLRKAKMKPSNRPENGTFSDLVRKCSLVLPVDVS